VFFFIFFSLLSDKMQVTAPSSCIFMV